MKVGRDDAHEPRDNVSVTFLKHWESSIEARAVL